MQTSFALLAAVLCFALSVHAQDDALPITEWLTNGPIEISLPMFFDTAAAGDDEFLDLIKLETEGLLPEKGDVWEPSPGQQVTWKAQTAHELSFPRRQRPYLVLIATYLYTGRAQEVALQFSWDGPVCAFLDGKAVASKPKLEDSIRTLSSQPFLHRGKHTLLIKALHVEEGDGHFSGTFSPKAGIEPESVSFSTDPRHAPSRFEESALFEELSSPIISPDGKWIAVIRSARNAQFKKESWLEVFDAGSRKLMRTIRMGKSISSPFFFPRRPKIAFQSSEEEGATIWSYDLVTQEQSRLLSDVKGLVKCECSPDEKYLYYSADGEAEKKEKDYELLATLEDRMSDWTQTRRLYVTTLPSGVTRALTVEGEFAVDEFALSREGDQLLFTRRIPKVGRPYYTTEFWGYHVATARAEKVLAQPIAFETRPLSFEWLPGGKKVAYVSAAFTTEEDDTSRYSRSETDLYLLDLPTGRTRNLTGDAPFTVEEGEQGVIQWNDREQRLWFSAINGMKIQLMKTDPFAAKPDFADVPLTQPIVHAYDVADNGSVVCIASGPTKPTAFYLRSPATGKETLVLDPNADLLPNLQLASTESWSFVNQDGLTIEGRLFFPPDFSSQKTWPLVVYFYGGVSPRDDRFTFTYHWWAANGYVVYVLNPVGCSGYGQAFADHHVNDWGTLATRDIIEGTQKLLADKSFLDPKKAGAYGGSYGGFIAMDLATKTDRFAALCSMSGISNISSYFGGGSWGFTYGDIALARSYPWNRRDVFVDKSPLFHADQIQTPLLLEHGSDDTNVPALESDQMFVSLKLLGKDVAYVRFPGEDHGFAKFTNRVAEREIVLEWFDKHLKGEPEGWEKRWKE